MAGDLKKPGEIFTVQNDNAWQTKKRARNFEDVLEATGSPGRYQMTQILMLMSLFIPMAFFTVKYVFISLEPPHTCSPVNETELFKTMAIPNNQTDICRTSYEDECNIDVQTNISGKWESIKNISCTQGYDYVGGQDVSFTSEWDLVCGESVLPQVSQAVIALGGLIGSILVNSFADKYGRWIPMVVSLALLVIAEIVTAYVPNIYSMIVLRFASGVASSGIYVCAYVLAFELIVSKKRVIFSVFSAMTWSLNIMCLCGVAYALRHKSWRQFQLYTGIVCLFPALFFYFINESPSWLQSVGKKQRAENIMRQACKTNGVDYDNEVKHIFEECFESIATQEVIENDSQSKVKTYTVADLFRKRQLLVILGITFFACFSNELVYTGLFLTASSLVGNLYLNISILAMTGIPAGFLNLFLLRYKGRKFVVILFTFILATCVLLSTCIKFFNINEDDSGNISLAFFVLGKFANNAGYNTLAMYIPEAFPTSVRTSGTGIATAGSFLGGIFAPFLVPLGRVATWAPGISLVVCGYLTVFLFTLLPETKDKQLTATLEADENDSNEKTALLTS